MCEDGTSPAYHKKLGFKLHQTINKFLALEDLTTEWEDASPSESSGSNNNVNQLFSWPQVMLGCSSLSFSALHLKVTIYIHFKTV